MENNKEIKGKSCQGKYIMDKTTSDQVRSMEIRCLPAGFWASELDIKITNLDNPLKKFSVYSITFNPDVDGKMQIGIHVICDAPGVKDRVECNYKVKG